MEISKSDLLAYQRRQETLASLAIKYHKHQRTVRKALLVNGVAINKRGWRPMGTRPTSGSVKRPYNQITKEIVEEYQKRVSLGETIKSIAKRHGRCFQSVFKVLQRYGTWGQQND